MMFVPRTKGLGSESFLKLNDREEVTGIFRGDIYKYKRHWANNRSSECVGTDCPSCLADPKNYPSFRFRINFVTTKDGQWVSKIFEGGAEIYDALSNLDRKFNLASTVVEITRRGLKQNTKYDIMPLVNQPITKEMEAKLKSVDLLSLSTSKTETSGD